MDAVWYRRYKRNGGGDGFLDWEMAVQSHVTGVPNPAARRPLIARKAAAGARG